MSRATLKRTRDFAPRSSDSESSGDELGNCRTKRMLDSNAPRFTLHRVQTKYTREEVIQSEVVDRDRHAAQARNRESNSPHRREDTGRGRFSTQGGRSQEIRPSVMMQSDLRGDEASLSGELAGVGGDEAVVAIASAHSSNSTWTLHGGELLSDSCPLCAYVNQPGSILNRFIGYFKIQVSAGQIPVSNLLRNISSTWLRFWNDQSNSHRDVDWNIVINSDEFISHCKTLDFVKTGIRKEQLQEIKDVYISNVRVYASKMNVNPDEIDSPDALSLYRSAMRDFGKFVIVATNLEGRV